MRRTVPSGWSTTSPVTVDVEGSDVTSGIQIVRWRKATTGAFTEVSGASTPVTFSTDGAHPLDTELVDKAGHASGTRHRDGQDRHDRSPQHDACRSERARSTARTG